MDWEELEFEYDAVGNGYVVTGVENDVIEDVDIPETYDDGEHGRHPVTDIGEGAFAGCKSLESITIPAFVTSIGKKALNCIALTEINVSEGNTSFKSIDGNLYGFDGTELIQYAIGKTESSFAIPDSVISIGFHAFGNCQLLENVTIPDSVISIGDEAFTGCIALESITLPDSATSLGNMVFSNCWSLGKATLSASLKTIGYAAFGFCDELEEITIPKSVASIGRMAFMGCDSLESAIFEDPHGWSAGGGPLDLSDPERNAWLLSEYLISSELARDD